MWRTARRCAPSSRLTISPWMPAIWKLPRKSSQRPRCDGEAPVLFGRRVSRSHRWNGKEQPHADQSPRLHFQRNLSFVRPGHSSVAVATSFLSGKSKPRRFMIRGWSVEDDRAGANQVWITVSNSWRTAWRWSTSSCTGGGVRVAHRAGKYWLPKELRASGGVIYEGGNSTRTGVRSRSRNDNPGYTMILVDCLLTMRSFGNHERRHRLVKGPVPIKAESPKLRRAA